MNRKEEKQHEAETSPARKRRKIRVRKVKRKNLYLENPYACGEPYDPNRFIKLLKISQTPDNTTFKARKSPVKISIKNQVVGQTSTLTHALFSTYVNDEEVKAGSVNLNNV